MNEHIHDALEEFKRAEHLMYVSLKYTRTVDVFRSIMERLIEALRIALHGLLSVAKEKGEIDEIPASPKLLAEEVKRIYSDDEKIVEMANLYLFLRRVHRAPFTRKSEFRRHVTMTSTLDNGEIIETTIDSIEEKYKEAKEALMHLQEKFGEERKDE